MNRAFTVLRKYLIYFLTLSIAIPQNFDLENLSIPKNNAVPSAGYIYDGEGTVKMNINIWGHVKSPGIYTVYDGIDLLSLLSFAGGPKEGAKLSQVCLYRQNPETEKIEKTVIDLDHYLDSGEPMPPVEVLPNDTFYIPETTYSFLVSQASLLNTALTIVSIALQIERIQND